MSVSDHLEEALDLCDELLLAETSEEVATIAVALRVHLLRGRDDLAVGLIDDDGWPYPSVTPNVAQTATQGPLRGDPVVAKIVAKMHGDDLPDAVLGQGVRVERLPDVTPPTKVRAIDVTCPACAAKPSKPCVATKNNAGGSDKTKGDTITGHHKARRDRAKEKNQ